MSKSEKSVVASLRPSEFQAGGLANDFEGEITKARFIPWNYLGRREKYTLAVQLTIEPSPRQDVEDTVVETYSSGSLEFFVPSVDGEEPAGASWGEYAELAQGTIDIDPDTAEENEGYFAIRAGHRKQLADGTKFAEFLAALKKDAGMSEDDMDPDVRFLEGLYGFFTRKKPEERSGIVAQRDDGRAPAGTLCLVELLDKPKASGVGKKTSAKGKAKPTKTKAKAKAKAEAEEEEGLDFDLDGTIQAVVFEAVSEAEDMLLPKQKALMAVARAEVDEFEDPKVKKQAMTRFKELLAAGKLEGLKFDEESNALTLG